MFVFLRRLVFNSAAHQQRRKQPNTTSRQGWRKEIILGALRLVLSGAVYVPSQAMAENAESTGTQSPGRAAVALTKLGDLGLTPRQAEVLAQMMRGRNNKEICRELGLAERTVKLHVTAVLNVLRVSSRTQAVLAATRLGLNPENLASGAGGR